MTLLRFHPKVMAAVLAASTLATSSAAFAAGQNQTQFTVSTTISNYCGIAVNQNIQFNGYSGATMTSANSTVTVTCNFSDNATPYVTMTSANNWNMHDPNAASQHPYLPYDLQYYVTAWNAYTTGLQIPLTTWSAQNTSTYYVRAIIPANEPATVNDTYTDTVTAYVNY